MIHKILAFIWMFMNWQATVLWLSLECGWFLSIHPHWNTAILCLWAVYGCFAVSNTVYCLWWRPYGLQSPKCLLSGHSFAWQTFATHNIKILFNAWCISGTLPSSKILCYDAMRAPPILYNNTFPYRKEHLSSMINLSTFTTVLYFESTKKKLTSYWN